MKTKLITVLILIVAITLTFGQNVKLDNARLSPRLLNYQGYLTDTQGNPVTGSFATIFSIYDASSGGNLKWSENQALNADKGIFHILLGAGTPIPDSVFTNSINRWLELNVAGIILSPRTQIVSAPYAYTAIYSDTAQFSRVSVPDNDWNYRITDAADTTLQTGSRWGLARSGNMLWGTADSTHVNFGVACTTGASSQNNKYCTVNGGCRNVSSRDCATVSGGYNNTADSVYATVGGGYANDARHRFATVGGGSSNYTGGYGATVAGGVANNANQSYATVGGGQYNTVTGTHSAVNGGYYNYSAGDYSTIAGGYADTISAAGDYSFLFGINSNCTQDSTVMLDMPHVWFGTEAAGYEFPRQRGANGQVLGTNASGQLSWVTDAHADSDWLFLISDTADTTLRMNGRWGLSRAGNVLHGNADSTHVNFGVACTTGVSGQNYKYATVSGGRYNSAGGNYATVAGGGYNSAGNWAVVGGGTANTAGNYYATVAGGYANAAYGHYSTVGGGFVNIANDSAAFIGGGRNNKSYGKYSVVCGGGGPSTADSNAAGGLGAAVVGGRQNIADTEYAFIGGGLGNTASGVSAVMGGGSYNAASGDWSIVVGGYTNIAGDTFAFVGGGRYNKARGKYSVVCGGGGPTLADSNAAQGGYSSVAGGIANRADSLCSAVGGGSHNTTGGTFATVAGGYSNDAGTYGATIAGGYNNTAIGTYATIGGGYANTTGDAGATIAGGNSNSAGGYRSSIGGGYSNSAGGRYATIPGGYNNSASGNMSFAAGYNANAAHRGSFVWADSSSSIAFSSTAADQFRVRAVGGFDLTGNVTVRNTSGTVVVELGEGLDYAEGFDVSDRGKIVPGTVLAIDPDDPGKLMVSDQPYDTRVAGISAGAKDLGSGVRLGNGQFDCDVALAGRVYCNVDATETGVEPGDLLTTSDMPGYAMKAADHDRARGAILGKAMQKLEKGQKGQILVLVTLQ